MDKIKEEVKWLIRNQIIYRAKRNPNNYHVSHTLAQMLETLCGAKIVDSAIPKIWKRKSDCALIDDPELNALAAEIVRHEQEDF